MPALTFNRVDILGIIQKHQQVIEDKTVLYIPLDPQSDRKDKALIILLTSLHGWPQFFGISAFLNDQRTDLLFLNDRMDSWYLEADSGESFSRVIGHFCSGYRPENVMIFGHSMAGYAALFHGMKHNINIMASNPQAAMESILTYGWPNLKLAANRMTNFIDLEQWMPENLADSAIYIVHARDPMDLDSVQRIRRFNPIRGRLILQTEKEKDHRPFFSLKTIAKYAYRGYDLLRTLRVAMNAAEAKTFPSPVIQIAQETPRCSPLLPHPSKIHWFNRLEHQKPGTKVTFVDCGTYDKSGRILGLRCGYDENNVWKPLSPPLRASVNLLENSDFRQWSQGRGPFSTDRAVTADNWFLLMGRHSLCAVEADEGFGARVTVKSTLTSKSILAQPIPCVKPKRKEQFSNRIMTIRGDFWVDCDEVFLEIVFRGLDGIRRVNRVQTTTVGQWERLLTYHLIPPNVERIHINVLFLGQEPEQTVRIRNIVAVLGYFPMGFSLEGDRQDSGAPL